MSRTRTSSLTALALATPLLASGLLASGPALAAPGTAAQDASTSRSAATQANVTQLALAEARAPKPVSKAQARTFLRKVHKLGKQGRYASMRKHASAKVVKHYKSWNAEQDRPSTTTRWRFDHKCLTAKHEYYRSYSHGKGSAGCGVWVELVGTPHEIATYSFITVTRKNGRLFANGITHLAG